MNIKTLLGFSSNISVNYDSSLKISTFFSCVDLISSSIASLDLEVMKQTKGRTGKIKHRLHNILNIRPSGVTGRYELIYGLINSAILYGDGYALIKRNGKYEANEIVPLLNNTVTSKCVGGRWYYAVTPQPWDTEMPKDAISTYTEEDIIHLKGYSIDGFNTAPVLTYMKDVIGSTISVNTYGKNYVDDSSASVKGVIKVSTKLKDANIMTKLANIFGGIFKSNQTPVLDDGMDYQTVDNKGVDTSQLVNSKQFNAQEIARFFHVPLSKLGMGNAVSYNSLEADNTNFIQTALMPWITKLENELSSKLLTTKEISTTNIEFSTLSMLRGDLNTRVLSYEKLFSIGAMSRNDIRESEGMPVIETEDGDEYYVMANLVSFKDRQVMQNKQPQDTSNN